VQALGRRISLIIRKSDSEKDRRRVLRSFPQWKTIQDGLPVARPRSKTLLVVRLDDIGDYLLFRNQLGMYRKSPRWQNYRITLLGNASWRDIFESLDQDAVDDVIWVRKNPYLDDPTYRLEIWRQLRDRGFETVIAASRTRPLLLDDLCMLAAAPQQRIGCENTYIHESWNLLSDSLYTSLFKPSRALAHEFQFNGEFAEWVCGIRYAGLRPWIEPRFPAPIATPYIVGFIGGSTRSRRWPTKRWIEFVRLLHRYSSTRFFLAGGNGRSELAMLHTIQQRTGAECVAGTVGLRELLHWIAGAQAVVTNDTMAAHMGVSFDKPTVIVANGINYMRFSEYGNAHIGGVSTVYPEVVNRRRKRNGDGPYDYCETVSADIASIRADTVICALKELCNECNGGMSKRDAAS